MRAGDLRRVDLLNLAAANFHLAGRVAPGGAGAKTKAENSTDKKFCESIHFGFLWGFGSSRLAASIVISAEPNKLPGF
jgi:hypothetical protein